MLPSMFVVVLMLHVGSAMLLVGGTLSASLVRRRIQSARTGEELTQWLDFGRRSAQLNPVFALILLGTGILLGSNGYWRDGWFFVAIAIWLLDSLLAVGFIQRPARAIGRALRESKGQLTSTVDALRSRPGWSRAIVALRANGVTLLYLMFQKPALPEALVVFALCHGVAFALSFFSQRAFVASESPAVAPRSVAGA